MQGSEGDYVPPPAWQRGAQLVACTAVALLGVQAVGAFRPAAMPFDVVCLLGAPMWLWMAVRQGRSSLGHPLLRAWLALCAATCLAALVSSPPGRPTLVGVVKGLQAATVVLGLSAVVRRVGAAPLLRAWLAGAAVCLSVAFAGYAVALFSEGGLAFRSAHPLFAGLPRMVGLFGNSPQHFGEFVVMSLGAAHVATPNAVVLARVVRMAGWPALALTFSSAWVGGVPLLPVVARLPSAWLRGAAALAAALAATWLMTFGLPSATSEPAPLDTLDYAHHVLECDERAQRCRERVGSWPYRAPMTLYRLSKQQALSAALEHFPFGLGPGGFEAYADAQLAARHGRHVPVSYDSPHSTYLGALAELGLPGFVALVLLCVALAARGHPASLHPLWLAVVGLMLVGLNIDVLRQRHLWVALALLAGAHEAERSRG